MTTLFAVLGTDNGDKDLLRIYSVRPPPPSPDPPGFLTPPVTNWMLLYSTLLCKKIARGPGESKNISSLRWRGGDRKDPTIEATKKQQS